MFQGLDPATGEQRCAPLWRADPHFKLTAGPLLQALKVRTDQQGVEDLEELAGSKALRGMCVQLRRPAGWAGRGGSRSRRSSASAARCWAPTPASCTAKQLTAPGNIAASEWIRGGQAFDHCFSYTTSKLFHRHAMLHESHERTTGRPTAPWSRLEAGRSDDLGPKS
jgi:hypothetical protein